MNEIQICSLAIYVVLILLIILEIVFMCVGGYKFRSTYSFFILSCAIGLPTCLIANIPELITVSASWEQTCYDLYIPFETISLTIMVLFYIGLVYDNDDFYYKFNTILYFVLLSVVLILFSLRIVNNFWHIFPIVLVESLPEVSSFLIFIVSIHMLILVTIWGYRTMNAIHVINKKEHFIFYIYHEINYLLLSTFHFIIDTLIFFGVFSPYYPPSSWIDIVIILFSHFFPVITIICIAHKFHISPLLAPSPHSHLESDEIIHSFLLAHSYVFEDDNNSDMNVNDLLEENSNDENTINHSLQNFEYDIGLLASKTLIHKNNKESPVSEIVEN